MIRIQLSDAEAQRLEQAFRLATDRKLLDRLQIVRLGRIKGQKRACGRGKHPAWIVAHAQLERFRNGGLLPLRKGE
jgi:hypothetical protein